MANDINRSIKIYIDSTEAGKSIEGLQEQIQKLEKELNSLNAEDPKQAARAKDLKKALEGSYKTLNTYKNSVAETDNVLRNLSGATYKELIAVKQRMTQELQKTARGTAEYNTKLEMLKRVSKETALAQKEMRVEVGCQSTMWGRSAGFINKYMGLIGSAVAGVLGLTMAFGKLRDERDKLEESKADVKALTGLDDESIEWLTTQAKQLSTTVTKEGIRIRQSATEILEAYKLVGSAKPELLENKEALAAVTEQTLILASASGMKLTDAVDAVTLAMNQYGAGADEAAKYVNALAAGSKFGAVAVESQTSAITKSGVSAAAANIPIEQLIGTIETLGEKGIKDEVAGTGLKKFFLTLQTGADDTNPKVVGLTTALENLRKKQMDAAAVKKMFGEEGYNVASVLINEADKVDYYTKAVTGTSVAMEQAAIKSETAASKMDQARNKMTDMGIELMEKLNPAITGVMNQTVHWTGKLMTLATWISENTGTIITAGAVLTAYTAIIKLHAYWQGVRAGKIAEVTIAEKWHLLSTKASLAGLKLYAAGHLLLTGNIKSSIIAMRSFLLTLGLNPIVAAGIAITALAVCVYKLATRTTDAKEAMNSFMESSIKEQTELNKLYGALKRSGEGTEQRTKLINEFNTKYGEYLPNLLTEKSTLEDIKTAYDNATTAMRENLAQKTLDAKVEEIETNALENKVKELNDVREKLTDLPESMIADAISNIVNQVDEGKNQGLEMQTVWRNVIENIRKEYFKDGLLPGRLGNELEDYVDEVYKAAEKVKAVKKELFDFLPKKKEEPIMLPEVVVTPDKANKPFISPEDAAKAEKKILDAKLKEVDQYVLQEQLKLKGSYLQNLMDKEDYNRQLEMLELDALNRRMTIYGLDKDKQAEIQDKILSHKVKILEQTRKFEESQEKYRQKDEKKEEKAKLDALNDDLQRIVAKNNEQQAEEYNEELKHRQRMVELAQGFSADIASIVGGAISGNSDIVKSSLVSIINMGLDALKIQCQMAVAGATMQSLAQADSVMTFGAAGFARAALLVGLIEAAFGAVKSVVGNLVNNIGKGDGTSSELASSSAQNTGNRVVGNGFFVGGDTGGESPYEVVGVVHGKEYVVPNFVYRQPAAMNHIAALEAMRRQKTNANPLPGSVVGFANGGYSGGSTSENRYAEGDKTLLSFMQRLIILLENMEGGIKAYVVYSDIEKKKQTLDKTRRLGGK